MTVTNTMLECDLSTMLECDLHYRNEILFFGFYRYVNSGESLTN